MEQLNEVIQTLEKLSANIDPRNNSTSSILIDIAVFFKHDLNRTIDSLKDISNDLERKTTSVGAEVAK